jgi:hypothetical protein
MRECGLVSSGSGYGSVVGSYEQTNEVTNSSDETFLRSYQSLSYWRISEGSLPCSQEPVVSPINPVHTSYEQGNELSVSVKC